MSRYLPLPALFAALMLSACGGPSINVQHQSAIQPSNAKYVSYYLLRHPVGRVAPADGVMEARIHQIMQANGYVGADREEADLLVSYKVLLTNGDGSAATGLAWNDPAWGDPMWNDGPDLPPGTVPASASEPTGQKTMLVLLQERETDLIVWLGWSEVKLTPSQLVETADRAITRIMASVPVSAGSPSEPPAPEPPTPTEPSSDGPSPELSSGAMGP